MSKEIDVDSAELEALMAELEAQNAEIIAEQKKAEPAPEPVVEVVAEPEPEPEVVIEAAAPAPEPEPLPVEEKIAEAPPKTKTDSAFASEPAKPGGLDFYVDVDQFRRDTAVSEATLDQCMIEQSGLRAYYGTLAARGEAQAGRMKARFEVLEATLYDHHRKELAASGEKTTEKMVENAVRLDPRWLKGKSMLIEAESIAAINKALVQSLADRRDMVIQLGADRRDEFKGHARILAEQQERDSLRDRALMAGQQRAA